MTYWLISTDIQHFFLMGNKNLQPSSEYCRMSSKLLRRHLWFIMYHLFNSYMLLLSQNKFSCCKNALTQTFRLFYIYTLADIPLQTRDYKSQVNYNKTIRWKIFLAYYNYILKYFEVASSWDTDVGCYVIIRNLLGSVFNIRLEITFLCSYKFFFCEVSCSWYTVLLKMLQTMFT